MGLVLYPDDYDKDPISSGTVTELPKGVVFLPAGGCRDIFNVISANTTGFYWSSFTESESVAYSIIFFSDPTDYTGDRLTGCSVRLVMDVTE